MSINLTYFDNLNIGNNQYPWYVPQVAITTNGTCYEGETTSVRPTTFFPQDNKPFDKEQATAINLSENSTVWFINPFNYTLCLFRNDKKGNTSCISGSSVCLSSLLNNQPDTIYNRALIVANNDTTLASRYLTSSARKLKSTVYLPAFFWLLMTIVVAVLGGL